MRIGSLCSGIGGLDLAVEEHYVASLAPTYQYQPIVDIKDVAATVAGGRNYQ